MPHPGLKVAVDENFQGRLPGMWRNLSGVQKEIGSIITICVFPPLNFTRN